MAWRAAVEGAPGGVRLLLEVSAGAKRPEFPAGYNPWRGRIGIRVAAPALEGRANKEVCALVAATIGLAKDHVDIVAGAHDPRKTVLLNGVAAGDVVSLLEGLL